MKPTIFSIPAANPYRLAIVPRPRGNDWLCDELSALHDEGIDVLVSMLTTQEAEELGLRSESEECKIAAMRLISIPIPDRSVPSDTKKFLHDVDAIIDLLREGHSVGIHCRASIGRSSIFAVSVLIRLGVDGTEAFNAVEAARGCAIPDTAEQRKWVLENIAR